MPIYKAVNVSEIINILNELDSDDEADQAITAAKDIDIVYIPPATIGSITDEEDLDDNKINLNDNNDDLMKEIAGSVELQYSLDEGNKQKLGDGYGSLIEEPSTSNTHNNGMERESIKKKSDFAIPMWRKPRNFSYSTKPTNNEAIKMEEIFLQIGEKLVRFVSSRF